MANHVIQSTCMVYCLNRIVAAVLPSVNGKDGRCRTLHHFYKCLCAVVCFKVELFRPLAPARMGGRAEGQLSVA